MLIGNDTAQAPQGGLGDGPHFRRSPDSLGPSGDQPEPGRTFQVKTVQGLQQVQNRDAALILGYIQRAGGGHKCRVGIQAPEMEYGSDRTRTRTPLNPLATGGSML